MTALLSILAVIAVVAYVLHQRDKWEHRRNVRRTLRLIENWYTQ